jgi:hypothetical protein
VGETTHGCHAPLLSNIWPLITKPIKDQSRALKLTCICYFARASYHVGSLFPWAILRSSHGRPTTSGPILSLTAASVDSSFGPMVHRFFLSGDKQIFASFSFESKVLSAQIKEFHYINMLLSLSQNINPPHGNEKALSERSRNFSFHFYSSPRFIHQDFNTFKHLSKLYYLRTQLRPKCP